MPTPNERPKTPQILFTRLARSYDRINMIASLGRDIAWRSHALALVDDLPTQDAWDLCCGTGAMGQVIKRRFPGARVHGVDCNQAMLDQCQASRHGIYQSITRARADRIPCDDEGAGMVALSLGFNDIEDQDATLQEIRRVLVAGGKFLSLELGLPEAGARRAVYHRFLTSLIAVRNRLGLTELGHLLDEILATPPTQDLIRRVESQGFLHQASAPIAGGLMYANLFTTPKDS